MTRGRLLSLAALASALAALALAPSASAGRLIESGHDIDFHCGGSQNTECNFVKVVVRYIRGGAPNPTKPVLVLDRDPTLDDPGNTPDVASALNKAFGTNVVPRTVVDPRSAAFTTTPIDTAHWSAIFIASDANCGGCDLNEQPSSGDAQTPDSTAIAARTDDISAFFASGGGIFAGAGDIDSGVFGGLTFAPANQPYYTFLATAGAGPAVGPFSLTSLGTKLGITKADTLPSCAGGCTHNSFGPPPAGSRLKAAETDPVTKRFITLVEDTDPPHASVTSGPNGATASDSATFAFSSNEGGGSFQCRVDNGAFGACASPKTVSGLSDGKHTFNVRAIDLVGNVQPTPTSFSWCQPGGKEVPGNRVDEDCNGFSAPFDSVDATIRFSFHLTGSRTQITLLNLSKVTSKAKLKVTCRGRGCPFKSKSVKLKKGRAKLSRLFKKHGRRVRLRRRTSIQLSLTRKGEISKVFRFKLRSHALPSFATRCQTPGSKKLRSRCPEFK
ncbi:MAG TPA: hypothetical protein VGF21_04100 [Thermoleophilaceae bacterium]